MYDFPLFENYIVSDIEMRHYRMSVLLRNRPARNRRKCSLTHYHNLNDKPADT